MKRLLDLLRKRREALVVAGFSLVTAVATLGSNRLLTEWVAPNALGELYLYLNLVMWLTLPTISVFVYITRHWAVAREHHAERRFAGGIARGLAVQAGIAAVAVVVLALLDVGLAHWVTAGFLFVATVAMASAQAIEPIQGMERRRVTAGLLTLVGQPGRQLALAFAGLAGVASGSLLLGVQAGYSSLHALVVIGAFLWLLHRVRGPEPERPTEQLGLRAILAYSIPTLLSNGAAQACASAERWGLANLGSPSDTAIFVQAVGLSTAAMNVPIGMLNSYFMPIITQEAARGPEPLRQAARSIRRYLVLSAAVCLLGSLGAALLAQTVTPIFFGARYAGVAGLLPWTTLGAALLAFGQALIIVPYTVRDALWPQVAALASRLVYVAALLLYVPAARPDLAFSRLFAAGNVVLVVLLGAVALAWVAHERRRPRPPVAPETA